MLGRQVQAPHGTCRSASRQHAVARSSRSGGRTSHVGRLQCVAAAQQASLVPLAPLDDKYERVHQFSNYANWLVPGSILLGRYPHVEPSRCFTRAQGEQQLSELLEAGVSTFISLQAELPPQDKMTLAGLNGFLPYRATAELIQAALNAPPAMESIHALRNPNLDKFLPKARKETSVYNNNKKLFFLHFPITDLSIPQQAPLLDLIKEFQNLLADNQVLYVHCWGGRGRAGTVGACLLQSLYGVSAEEALERVQRSFSTRGDEGFRSPETDEQFEFVRSFDKALKA